MNDLKAGDLVLDGATGRRALIIGEKNIIPGMPDVVRILWFDTGKTRYIRKRYLTKLEDRGE